MFKDMAQRHPDRHKYEAVETDEPARRKDNSLKLSWSGKWAACGVVCAVGIVLVLFLQPTRQRRDKEPVAGTDYSKYFADSSGALPIPPQPYQYDAFMSWFRATNWTQYASSLKMVPAASWFDVDHALKTKSEWFQGQDTSAVQKVAKSINRYLFMSEIALSGDDSTQAGMPLHLYVLQHLRDASARKGATFLDAGCGTGYLLVAWELLAGTDARALGFDLNPATVKEARHHLASANAVDESALQKLISSSGSGPSPKFSPDGTPSFPPVGQVTTGNLLSPEKAADELGIKPGEVDAINVGAAVGAVSDLLPLARLLRTGGLLLAPVCDAASDQPANIPKGRCAELFQIFRKAEDGSIAVVPGTPKVAGRFVAATMPALRGSR
eukprot:gnl/TRDRNA2_/TRDRNA2_191875_c0_seq1.p1 gnl/TRDRNA2_/TRDRNA2_191875_c0~~gnl/TRDRNA2_/TRDRNA2_191875_c0_seq1.p1  ORF type:complete len:383 (-),score=62.27 gnl/TRDRNA2_/TRDRNA2_191875_c0_seq1:75-1223(-)